MSPDIYKDLNRRMNEHYASDEDIATDEEVHYAAAADSRYEMSFKTHKAMARELIQRRSDSNNPWRKTVAYKSPKELIKTYQDFPRAGIRFRDVMPLLAVPEAFTVVTSELVDPTVFIGVQKIIGLEARGFIFGAAAARLLKVGFVPFRKPGKLPGPVMSFGYNLEYGTDKLEVQENAISPGERVLVVDDLLATGGTALAALKLAKACGATIVGCAFVIELSDLKGRALIEEQGFQVHSLYTFAEDE